MFLLRAVGVSMLIGAMFAGVAGGQSGRGSTVTGELRGNGSGTFLIELYDQAQHHVVERVRAGLGESFGFHDVRNGEYVLRVTDRTGNLITQEYVRVGEIPSVVSLTVPDSATSAQRPATGTVSVAQLQRKIPKEARKQFEKGMKAAGKGENEPAIEHLKQALAAAPDFLEAHNNLAARYLFLGRFAEAVPHLERAAELDLHSAAPFSNLAIAYLHLGRPVDAERAARHAVRIDPGASKSRFMLGMALAALNRDEPAVRYLAGVAEEFPKARLALASIAARQGRNSEAVNELKRYLARDNVEARADVEQWLARIQAAVAAGGH